MGYKFSLLKIIAFGTSTCQRCLETLTATTTVSRNWKDVATRQVYGVLDSKFHFSLGSPTPSRYGCPKVLHHIEYSGSLGHRTSPNVRVWVSMVRIRVRISVRIKVSFGFSDANLY